MKLSLEPLIKYVSSQDMIRKENIRRRKTSQTLIRHNHDHFNRVWLNSQTFDFVQKSRMHESLKWDLNVAVS